MARLQRDIERVAVEPGPCWTGREVAGWLGDTPSVARKSYIDPRLTGRYESEGELPTIPALPAVLPAPAAAEMAVAALLTVPA